MSKNDVKKKKRKRRRKRRKWWRGRDGEKEKEEGCRKTASFSRGVGERVLTASQP